MLKNGMNGEELKATLKALHIKQNDLAERLGVGYVTVSRWATSELPVPGYVQEYMRVLVLAAEILRK